MDPRKPVAFLSYARADDRYARGKIVKICELLGNELQAQTGEPFTIFVDRNHIDWGENWESRIYESLETATLLVPVITPSYFNSDMCRKELTKFLEQERRTGRSDLILPIYYIEAPVMEDATLRQEDKVAQELARRQYADWRKLRLARLDSKAVLGTIEDLAKRMRKAVERSQETTHSETPIVTVKPASVGQAARGSVASAATAGGQSGLGVLHRRRLATILRRLRQSAGLTLDQVAGHLYVSSSKISRMETGRVRARRREVLDMLNLYGVGGQERDAILQLATEAERTQKAWWAAYDASQIVGAYLAFVDAATSIYMYEPSRIPGLLQVEEYAREIIRGSDPNMSAPNIERHVALRMRQQASFFDHGRSEVSVILDEAPLRRLTGGARVMHRQLLHLIEIAALPNVTMQVLSFAEGSGTASPFTILSFLDPADPDIVCLENDSGQQFIEESSTVQQYRHLFERLVSVAFTPEESLYFVHMVAREL
jgi:transcriptional regulator with XRE-family HTH domain